MKFIHMADMHFDTAFQLLNSKVNMGTIRRLDQRNIFNAIIEKIKKEHINYLFISGDLYEHKYIKKSTIEFINNKFKEIPDTRIFISPGNHDPFIKNSYYNTFKWNDNTKIFSGKLEKIETPDANIYGFGFTDFNSDSLDFDITLDNKKPNILVIHGSLDGQDVYNPLSSSKLKLLGFDYIALGHIHKTNYRDANNIVYPGSPISMGFDEMGDHGFVEGELLNNSLNIKFIKTDNTSFISQELDISDILSLEDLAEKINSIKFNENEFIKLLLNGQKQFEFNVLDLQNLIFNKNVLKIKDFSKINLDLSALSNEKSLKGVYIKNLLKKLNDPNYNKNEVEKAISIALELFN